MTIILPKKIPSVSKIKITILYPNFSIFYFTKSYCFPKFQRGEVRNYLSCPPFPPPEDDPDGNS